MKQLFKISQDANPNYLAKICTIDEVFPIEKADNLVRTVVDGFDMVVSKDTKPGDVVIYFPVETAISEKFLGGNNLFELSQSFRNSNGAEVEEILNKIVSSQDEEEIKTLNAKVKTMCGFFNKHGRVRMIKLRGQYSMGFIIPVNSLKNVYKELENEDLNQFVGTQFDTVLDEQFCWKYVPVVPIKHEPDGKTSRWKKLMKRTQKKFNRLIENQWEFHYDTKKLEDQIQCINPDDTVTISTKVHGTSVILSNILCKRQLNWIEKIKKFFRFKVQETEYANIYSSRKVIKNQYINKNVKNYYNDDVWGCVNKVFSKFITEGMTVYGEIVGYCQGSSQMIQKNHDYGCQVGQWKFMPYRITMTAIDGSKSEWDVRDVKDWVDWLLENFGEDEAYTTNEKIYYIKDCLMPMDILYHGKFNKLYKDIPVDDEFYKNILQRMKNDETRFLMEKNEPLCKNKVPREGIVIRIEGDKFTRAWKLKTKRHYSMEAEQHDNGEVDMEEIS